MSFGIVIQGNTPLEIRNYTGVISSEFSDFFFSGTPLERKMFC